jgi:hypothetical protein
LTVVVIIYSVVANFYLRSRYAHSFDTNLVAWTGFFEIATGYTHSDLYFARKGTNFSRWAAVVGCTPWYAHICFVTKLLEWAVRIISTPWQADGCFKWTYRLTDFPGWAVFVRVAYGYTHTYITHKYTNFSLGAVFRGSTTRYTDI